MNYFNTALDPWKFVHVLATYGKANASSEHEVVKQETEIGRFSDGNKPTVEQRSRSDSFNGLSTELPEHSPCQTAPQVKQMIVQPFCFFVSITSAKFLRSDDTTSKRFPPLF